MRCFIIRAKRIKHKNIYFAKKLCRKANFRRIFLHIPKITFSFHSNFLSNKIKIIAATGIASVFVLCFALTNIATKPKTNAIAVFSHSSSEKIISEVLPNNNSSSSINKIKKFLSEAIKKDPEEIVKSYGGILSEIKKHDFSPTPTPSAATNTEAPPQEKTISSQSLFKNETKYEIEAGTFKDTPLPFSENPKILIIHTHTTESYTPEEPTGVPDSSRSTDENKNMIAIGALIKTGLEKSGFDVIHDKTVHDYPSYQGSYGRSLTTAQNQLNLNPDIQIILDIHRDAIVNKDGTKVKTIKNINNIPCAQVMLVCGTDSGGLVHPQWHSNLNFALKLQEKAENKYPGLMRPINLRNERFNQHLAPGSLILEIGTHGNTLTEAKHSAKLIAETIAELLK